MAGESRLMPPVITLLTDFGTRDSYVGEVRAVLASQANPALLVDITRCLIEVRRWLP